MNIDEILNRLNGIRDLSEDSNVRTVVKKGLDVLTDAYDALSRDRALSPSDSSFVTEQLHRMEDALNESRAGKEIRSEIGNIFRSLVQNAASYAAGDETGERKTYSGTNYDFIRTRSGQPTSTISHENVSKEAADLPAQIQPAAVKPMEYDRAVFSELARISNDVFNEGIATDVPASGVSVQKYSGSLAEAYLATGGKETDEDYLFLKSISENSYFDKYAIDSIDNCTLEGGNAILLSVSEGKEHGIIAVGTKLTENDFFSGSGEYSQNETALVEAVRNVSRNYSTFELTGSENGGTASIIAGLQFDESESNCLTGITTHNMPKMSEVYLNAHASDIGKLEPKTTHYETKEFSQSQDGINGGYVGKQSTVESESISSWALSSSTDQNKTGLDNTAYTGTGSIGGGTAAWTSAKEYDNENGGEGSSSGGFSAAMGSAATVAGAAAMAAAGAEEAQSASAGGTEAGSYEWESSHDYDNTQMGSGGLESSASANGTGYQTANETGDYNTQRAGGVGSGGFADAASSYQAQSGASAGGSSQTTDIGETAQSSGESSGQTQGGSSTGGKGSVQEAAASVASGASKEIEFVSEAAKRCENDLNQILQTMTVRQADLIDAIEGSAGVWDCESARSILTKIRNSSDDTMKHAKNLVKGTAEIVMGSRENYEQTEEQNTATVASMFD